MIYAAFSPFGLFPNARTNCGQIDRRREYIECLQIYLKCQERKIQPFECIIDPVSLRDGTH